MALYVIGGCYNKDGALKVLRNMKYYSPDLKEREWMKEDVPGSESGGFIGLIPTLMYSEERMHEDYLVERLRMVRSILERQGDDAIDAFLEITSPKPDETLDKLRDIDRLLGSSVMGDMVDELSTPLTKKQFYHYLEIYNEFYGTT